MFHLQKDSIRFYLILIVELVFSPFLYLKNFVLNSISSSRPLEKRKSRKDVETDVVYVNIHEWGGYKLERKKKISIIPEFSCGLKFQLERFNNEKQTSNIFLNVTLSDPELHNDLDFIKSKSDCVDFVNNDGMDFSGYSFFYEKIKDKKNSYVILTNSSVNSISDLFLREYIDFMENNKQVGILGVSYCSKMIQTLIKNNFTPHLQSFFYLTTIDVLREIVEKNNGFPGKGITHKLLLIRKGEIGVSQLVRSLGYQLAVVTEGDGVQCFGENGFWDNGKRRWKLKMGDFRLHTQNPNRINKIS